MSINTTSITTIGMTTWPPDSPSLSGKEINLLRKPLILLGLMYSRQDTVFDYEIWAMPNVNFPYTDDFN